MTDTPGTPPEDDYEPTPTEHAELQTEERRLSLDEEHDLIDRAKRFDPKAQDDLYRHHEKRIKFTASRVRIYSVPIEDRYQDGALGFVRAIGPFDLAAARARRQRFWPYAKKWVRGAVIRGCSKELGLRDRARSAFEQVVQADADLTAELGRRPTDEEVAARSGVKLTYVEEVRRALAHPETPLIDDWDDEGEADERVGVVVPSSAPEPDDCARRRNNLRNVPVRVQILGALESLSDYNYREIAEILRRPDDAKLAAQWPSLLADACLIEAVPTTWSAVCELFATPPPAVTDPGLRQHMRQFRENHRQAADDAKP